MHPIIYDVAVSLDGYISGPEGDVSKFAHDGHVVDDYAARMAGYTTAIMGRVTYTFGYQYGMQPGQNPYPHMQTHVFSATLEVPSDSAVTVWRNAGGQDIKHLKERASGPIYLCGGGAVAGWLLRQGLIDVICLKRAPIILGGGVKLFGDAHDIALLTRGATKTYDNGYLLEELST